MFRNHIKIAWRNMKRTPFFSLLNVFGLSIGLAGCLLISFFIYDELSFDKIFRDSDRIHRVNVAIKFGGSERKFSVAPAPMASHIKRDFDEVELVTRFRTEGGAMLKRVGAKTDVKHNQVAYADYTFFKMFDISLLKGDVSSALKEPNTIVLTKSAAEKHFGSENPIGQMVKYNNHTNYKVVGVISDFSKRTFLRGYSFLMSMEGYADSKVINWGSNNYHTFLKLIPSAKIESIQKPLNKFLGKYVIPNIQQFIPDLSEESLKAAGNYLKYSTIPLEKIHLYSHREAEMSRNNDIKNVYMLSVVALILLVLACVNYMNLATSLSLKRAKEVGVRKTLGSSRTEIVVQFLVESFAITFGALVIALILTSVLLPYFNELSGKEITFPIKNLKFWLVLIVFSCFIGLISGSYPSFFMTRFSPLKVLRGGDSGKGMGSKTRNILVVFQFSISVFLIASTLVVNKQLNFIQSKDLGYDKEQILIINDVYSLRKKVKTFQKEVSKLSTVENTTLTSFFPTPSPRRDESFMSEEKGINQESSVNMQSWRVDYDYIPTLKLELVAGRNFIRGRKEDWNSIIVNETAVKKMNLSLDDVLGKRFTPDLGESKITYYTVIGVVKDFHYSTLKNEIKSLSLKLSSNSDDMAIRLNSKNISESIEEIENIWKELIPSQPMTYYFMDDSFANTFIEEQRLSKIFMIFTFLSILIASLGLLGLSIFNAEQRIKEIGVRKVLGATITQIMMRLVEGFIILVIKGVIIGVPLAWFIMNRWLEDFSYRVSIDGIEFLIASFIAIITSLLTVSYQSIKVALRNPIKSLRTE